MDFTRRNFIKTTGAATAFTVAARPVSLPVRRRDNREAACLQDRSAADGQPEDRTDGEDRTDSH